MIIDKNGKIFGKISIIDIAVILVILVAIIGVSLRFISAPSKSAKQKINLTYVVEIEGVRSFTVDAFQKKGKVIDAKQKCLVGEIEDVEFSAQKKAEFDNDGNVVYAEVPDKYNVKVKIKAQGKESEHGYFVGSDTELCVGSTVKIATKYVNSTGKVQEIVKE